PPPRSVADAGARHKPVPQILHTRGLAGSRGETGFDEVVQIAVEVAGGVALVGAGPVVLDEVIGMKGDRADLAAEVRLDVRPLEPRRLALALLDLALVEAGLEHAQRQLAVLDLRALVLAGNDDAGGLVAQAHSGVGFVEVLAALAG